MFSALILNKGDVDFWRKEIAKYNISENLYLQNAMLNRYVVQLPNKPNGYAAQKVRAAVEFFGSMKEKDVITYNTMLKGYSFVKDIASLEKLYNQMKRSSIKPDQVTYLYTYNITICLL
jgi:pentatricopeptide repeat protein